MKDNGVKDAVPVVTNVKNDQLIADEEYFLQQQEINHLLHDIRSSQAVDCG